MKRRALGKAQQGVGAAERDCEKEASLWSSRGAKFVTEPEVHATELRCYMRDPGRVPH
jgi:hypothetical protein